MQKVKSWLVENRYIVLIMLLFVMMAGTYSVVTPLFEMSDELWHYPMVKTLADGNGLPVQDPDNHGPWKQEGSQPPLYYYLGAGLTFWIDTSDVGEVLRPNPHVDNGVITPDGNINLIVHNYDRETQWRGTVLAVHLVRLMSVILSTVTLYFTYLIGKEVFPEKEWLALAGAAAVGFTPMFTFISGAVNNDNLAVLLAAVGLWLMMRIAKAAQEGASTLKLAIILGVALGLSALTKASVLGQFGLAGLTMAYAAFKQKRWQTFFVEGPIIIGIALAIAGWWYWRNYVLYGDPFGLNVFIEILGQRARPATYAQLWTERFGFMQSYWGLFGGVNVPMDGWIYAVLNTLFVVSWVGVIVYLVLKFRRDGAKLDAWLATILSLLWIVAVIFPLASYWARITWSSQGRLVFSAIMSINLWFIAGLSAWLPDRFGRWVAAAVTGFMAAITAVSPFLYIKPAYISPDAAAAAQQPAEAVFSEPGQDTPKIKLVEYDVQTDETTPGGQVEVMLTWETLAPMERNWSTFIHLQDSYGFRAGQRDTYPGLGLIATTEIEPGRLWTDHYVVPVGQSAYAPDTLDVIVGLWDFNTGERMVYENGENALKIAEVALDARNNTSDVPNPVTFNYGDKIDLVGYELSTREVAPGESIDVTLYWEAREAIEENYTVSVQVLGPETQRYAALDRWTEPATSAWLVGETIKDTYTVTVSEDTPPGEYPVQVVVYSLAEDGQIEKLQLINTEGRLIDDFVLLTVVRVTQGE